MAGMSPSPPGAHKPHTGDEPDRGSPPSNAEFGIGLARAFAGAFIFSSSLMMTMEMWWLGFYMDRGRMALFTAVSVMLLIGLAHYWGFRHSMAWQDSVIDGFVGYAVGVVTALILLLLLGQITPNMSLDEFIGKVALQAIAGGIGALLARSQLGGGSQAAEPPPGVNYWAELFLMIAGALFLAFTVAPTEEMILIAYTVTPWHTILMMLISLVILHTFVYEVEFRGQEQAAPDTGFWSLFLRFTVAGYVCVFLTSLYILWTFGRVDGMALLPVVMTTVVLSLPGSLGAAVARLIL